MSKLVITRGLPGSGKSTWAREQQAADLDLWRVNRDDLRAMVRPTWTHGDKEAEEILTMVQHAVIRVLLESTDMSVVVDDTNLHSDHVRQLEQIAYEIDEVLLFEEHDFTDVPLETCIERDAARPNPVGREVIERMHAKYLAGAA